MSLTVADFVPLEAEILKAIGIMRGDRATIARLREANAELTRHLLELCFLVQERHRDAEAMLAVNQAVLTVRQQQEQGGE